MFLSPTEIKEIKEMGIKVGNLGSTEIKIFIILL